MTVITTRIQVAPDRTMSGRLPADVPPGEHVVVIQIADRPARQLPALAFDAADLPTLDLGPWPEELSLRREEMYGDDGR